MTPEYEYTGFSGPDQEETGMYQVKMKMGSDYRSSPGNRIPVCPVYGFAGM